MDSSMEPGPYYCRSLSAGPPQRLHIVLKATALNARSFTAIMLAADEAAERYAERRGDWRENSLVSRSAGFQPPQCAGEDVRLFR